MAFVVTLIDFTPLPRYDNKKWTQAEIYESSTSTGPWTLLETKTIADYPDATNPPTLSFTTELATLASGWYKIRFLDATGDQAIETTPVQNALVTLDAWAPTPDEVAALMRARTKDSSGVEKGHWTSKTRPTLNEVMQIIKGASDDVADRFGDVSALPTIWDLLSEGIKFEAAMQIELSYFPEQVVTGRSPFEQYRELFNDKMA